MDVPRCEAPMAATTRSAVARDNRFLTGSQAYCPFSLRYSCQTYPSSDPLIIARDHACTGRYHKLLSPSESLCPHRPLISQADQALHFNFGLADLEAGSPSPRVLCYSWTRKGQTGTMASHISEESGKPLQNKVLERAVLPKPVKRWFPVPFSFASQLTFKS